MTIDASLLVPYIINPGFIANPDAAVPVPTTLGRVYTFNKTGDALATHQHPPDQTHVCIVLSGSLTMTDAGVSRTVVAGDVVDLGTQPHGFVALEPAQIINIIKTGVTQMSLAKLTSQINDTISHLYNRINNLNNLAETQAPTDVDLTSTISTLQASISDLKALVDS
jgi:hypothetical protein